MYGAKPFFSSVEINTYVHLRVLEQFILILYVLGSERYRMGNRDT